MSLDETVSELDRAARAFKARMLRAALHHRTEIDARTLTIAQRNRLMKNAKPLEMSQITADILTNPNHPARVTTPDGPMVYYRVGDAKSVHAVTEIADVLLSSPREMRLAAMAYLGRWLELDTEAVTPRTRGLITDRRNDLVNGDERTWPEAAVLISDALRDDIFANIAGLRQALTTEFKEGALKYALPVFQPSVKAVDSIDLGVWQPSSERDKVATIVRELIKKGDAGDIFREYFAKLGHLPLDGSLSVASILAQLTPNADGNDVIWRDIWKAVDEVGSPFARYHALVLFIRLPHLIPNGEKGKIWTEVSRFVTASPARVGDDPFVSELLRRSALARHYFDYFACRLPGISAERLAVMAWWLSDRVEGVMAKGGALANELTESVAHPALVWSSTGIEIGHPRMEPSSLAYVTSAFLSPWSFALQCQLAGALEGVYQSSTASPLKVDAAVEAESQEESGQATEDAVGEAIAGSLGVAFASAGKDAAERVYGFDAPIDGLADAWTNKTASAHVQQLLLVLVPLVRTLTTSGGLAEALKNLPTAEVHERLLAATALRSAVHAGNAPLEELWQLLLKREWRDSLLLKADEQTLQTVLEAFAEIQIQKGEQWRNNVPHWLALAAVETSDERRRDLLLAFLVSQCISTDTDSAISRITHMLHKPDAVKELRTWGDRLQRIVPNVSAWVGGKIRGCMPALRAS